MCDNHCDAGIYKILSHGKMVCGYLCLLCVTVADQPIMGGREMLPEDKKPVIVERVKPHPVWTLDEALEIQRAVENYVSGAKLIPPLPPEEED